MAFKRGTGTSTKKKGIKTEIYKMGKDEWEVLLIWDLEARNIYTKSKQSAVEQY